MRDFSPEEPALSEVEGALRASLCLPPKFMLAPRKLLRKLSMTPRLGDDAVL